MGALGLGSALKPACEPITVARKPISEKNLADNHLKWGVGGINIDGCRVEGNEELGRNNHTNPYGSDRTWSVSKTPPQNNVGNAPQGRFPANLIHDGSDEVVGLFPQTKSGAMNGVYKNTLMTNRRGERDGKEIHLHQEASSGSASRFFYCAKASKRERNIGCEGLEEKQTTGGGGLTAGKREDGSWETASAGGKYGSIKAKQFNSHPTVKPIALMEYLVKLVSREGQVVLDPFMGSGTTGMACKKLDREFVGIEMMPEYMEIAKARIEGVKKDEQLNMI